MRLHFPPFRQGNATIYELVTAVVQFLAHFALPRAEIAAVDNLYGQIAVEDFKLKSLELFQSAVSMFKRANKATNRNGEVGELLLYLLTEWILEAPQLIAKMSLKTNREMPVHGSDGIHVRYDKESSKLLFYWGESKLYADVGQAISAAVKSLSEALTPSSMQHELELVQRNINFAGLDAEAKSAILRYLDPYDEASNQRHDVATCLIGFDFDGFKQVSASDGASAEVKFCQLATAKLETLSAKIANALTGKGMGEHRLEIFFFPVPSVQELRDQFQEKIGWGK